MKSTSRQLITHPNYVPCLPLSHPLVLITRSVLEFSQNKSWTAGLLTGLQSVTEVPGATFPSGPHSLIKEGILWVTWNLCGYGSGCLDCRSDLIVADLHSVYCYHSISAIYTDNLEIIMRWSYTGIHICVFCLRFNFFLLGSRSSRSLSSFLSFCSCSFPFFLTFL